jgi:hypothetical protein
VVVQFNNCVFNVAQSKQDGEGEKKNDFDVLRCKLEDIAASRSLKKHGGYVYEPVPGCPCAYTSGQDYDVFIRSELRGDPKYTSNVHRFEELRKYLQLYDEVKFPFIEFDRDVISFSNGILELSKGIFTTYESLSPGHPKAKCVARHHIHLPYTGNTDTPSLTLSWTSNLTRT